MAKNKGGFIGQDGLNAPDSPTGVSATASDGEATISFTAPSDVGGSAITGYRAQSNDGIGGSGSSSPVTVTGLTNGTSYTFNVWAINAFGYSAPSDASGSVSPIDTSNRAIYAGGEDNSGRIDIIQYFNITSTGNATDFGDLASARSRFAGCASSTRGVFSGGEAPSADNVIQYITISSTGNSTDFGDLLGATSAPTSLSSSTRGVIAGGELGSYSDVIQYITIASTGNATDFGDLRFAVSFLCSCASSTRGVIFPGSTTFTANKNDIQYITIASTGNAVDFGETLANNENASGCSNSTRGLMGGGETNAIQYITIASTGNATDFGDLNFTGGSTQWNQLAACANDTRATFGGGSQFGTTTNAISYVTIASTGNASDFGDLVSVSKSLAACSNAHGGLS
jgi:hypothetical protein